MWSVKDINLSFCYRPEVYPIFKIPMENLDQILNKHRLCLLRSCVDLSWFIGFTSEKRENLSCVQRLFLPYFYWCLSSMQYWNRQQADIEDFDVLYPLVMKFLMNLKQCGIHWPLVVWELSSIFSMIEILGKEQYKWLTQVHCWTEKGSQLSWTSVMIR